jgi:hypothetical protein
MNFTAGSDQYQWLAADLAQVDRAVTPWLVVCLHAPWCDHSFGAFLNITICIKSAA